MSHVHMRRQSIPCTCSWHRNQVQRVQHSRSPSPLSLVANGRVKRTWRVSASAEQTPEMRDTIKRLTKLFYFDQAPGGLLERTVGCNPAAPCVLITLIHASWMISAAPSGVLLQSRMSCLAVQGKYWLLPCCHSLCKQEAVQG